MEEERKEDWRTGRRMKRGIKKEEQDGGEEDRTTEGDERKRTMEGRGGGLEDGVRDWQRRIGGGRWTMRG